MSSVVFFNDEEEEEGEEEDDDDDEAELLQFELNEKWAKRFAATELKRRERRQERARENRKEQPVSGRVERARARAEETMREWEELE